MNENCEWNYVGNEQNEWVFVLFISLDGHSSLKFGREFLSRIEKNNNNIKKNKSCLCLPCHHTVSRTMTNVAIILCLLFHHHNSCSYGTLSTLSPSWQMYSQGTVYSVTARATEVSWTKASSVCYTPYAVTIVSGTTTAVVWYVPYVVTIQSHGSWQL